MNSKNSITDYRTSFRFNDQVVYLTIAGRGRNLAWEIRPEVGRPYAGKWVGDVVSAETFALTYALPLLKSAPKVFQGRLFAMHDGRTKKGLLFELQGGKLKDTGLEFDDQAAAEAYAKEAAKVAKEAASW